MRCAYCGETADSMDHVVPVSTLAGGRSAATRDREHCVPCCRECNSLLGDRGGDTVGSRAGYLAAVYRVRYAQALAQPHWFEDEIDELGPNLRAEVERALSAKRSAQDKIDACELVAMTSPRISEIWAEHDERLSDAIPAREDGKAPKLAQKRFGEASGGVFGAAKKDQIRPQVARAD